MSELSDTTDTNVFFKFNSLAAGAVVFLGAPFEGSPLLAGQRHLVGRKRTVVSKAGC